MSSVDSTARRQEEMYRLPYHWFPEDRLPKAARVEKQRIVSGSIRENTDGPIRRFLDVGCGDGRWTADIQQMLGPDVEAHGIDISERAIGFARLISPQIRFTEFAGQEFPFADETFDLVSSIEVIEHIAADGESLHLQEIRRVLKPRGLLVLTTPSHLLPLPPHHVRHYTVERLRDLFGACGFAVAAFRGQTRPCYSRFARLRKTMNRAPLIWKPWRYALRETAPSRALNLIVAARRGE